MPCIHGGSPSGLAWLVDGRPDEVGGRAFVGELVEVWRDVCELTFRLAVPLAFRLPEVGFVLEGIRAFGGDLPVDDVVSIGAKLGGVDGSSASWLPALPSSGPPDPPPLPLRLLGNGESRSIKVEGTGRGLLFLTGIREVAGRIL